MVGALLHTIRHMWPSLRLHMRLRRPSWLQELPRRQRLLPRLPRKLQQQLPQLHNPSSLHLNLSPSPTLNRTHTPIHTRVGAETAITNTTATVVMRLARRPQANRGRAEAREMDTRSSDPAQQLDRHPHLPCTGHEPRSMVRFHQRIFVRKV